MQYSDILASLSLIVSFVSIYLSYYFSRKTARPAISYYCKDLPPYANKESETTITVKNVGTARAKINAVSLTFSWDKNLKLFLYDEKEHKRRYYLSPNEEEIFHKRLPEPPSEKPEILTITTKYDDSEAKQEDIPVRKFTAGIAFL